MVDVVTLMIWLGLLIINIYLAIMFGTKLSNDFMIIRNRYVLIIVIVYEIILCPFTDNDQFLYTVFILLQVSVDDWLN